MTTFFLLALALSISCGIFFPLNSSIKLALNSENVITDDAVGNKFDYSIKIADFYFKNTAVLMLDRIKKETSVNKASIHTLSNTQFRVFLGPFNDINSLQKAFNDINVLEFENIEIIKNEKYN